MEEGILERPDSAPGLSGVHCHHCGTKCISRSHASGEHLFCCNGCLAVYELLRSSGLEGFYELDARAGIRVGENAPRKFAYLDEPAVRERLVVYADSKITRVIFRLPAIHCIACVWLLENLFRIDDRVTRAEVNFPRKEVAITFRSEELKLSELVTLLASLGYEPDLKLSDLQAEKPASTPRKLWVQLGVAGFAFGNNMLFSIALYLGVDAFSGPAFRSLVGYVSLILSLPVLLYSAQDYFRLALNGLKHRLLTIEVPIAAGILVIFGQSSWEVLSGRGEGYFDSFAGLLFFLLCGRLFQQKTYDRLAFDRDYKSFFPLSVTRRQNGREEVVSLASLKIGDRLVIRNGELIPADARHLNGAALIDYSFVTGESEAVEKEAGDYLYAGGRQIGGTIEIETIKSVSQSYLTSLWNQDIFRKESRDSLDSLINRYSQRFTKAILLIAIAAALYWSYANPANAIKAFASVLIVACPCALALAAPFTLGTAVRVLGRAGIFLKSPQVVENLAVAQAIAFDKTGTLTGSAAGTVVFEGAPLDDREIGLIASVTRHSTHPYAVRITEILTGALQLEARSFTETPGCGMHAVVDGAPLLLGSKSWLELKHIAVPKSTVANGSTVHVAIDGAYRGYFVLTSSFRADTDTLINELAENYSLAVISGDNERERSRLEQLFGTTCNLRFNQSPIDKLSYIREIQSFGESVVMVGDGLNDAGALKQSNVGIAVVENIGAFSPASDVIMSSQALPRLGAVLRFSKGAVRIVRLSFLVSTLYNTIGITIAARAELAPIVCAILMPLSSISVVAFACSATTLFGRHVGLQPKGNGL